MSLKLGEGIPQTDILARELQRPVEPAAMPHLQRVETNAPIQLLSEKMLGRLAEYGVEVRDPNAVMRALTVGERGDPRVPEDVKLDIVRECVRENTAAVKAHQAFTEGLLRQLNVDPGNLAELAGRLPDRSSAELVRTAIFAQLLNHTFESQAPDQPPKFQTWNRDQLMEALNVFRTLGMHEGVVMLYDRVRDHYADTGRESPWNSHAQHLFAYALNRIGNPARAQLEMERLTIDGRANSLNGGAGSLTFAGLAENHTKNARLIESIRKDIAQDRQIDEGRRQAFVNIVQSLPSGQELEVLRLIERQALERGNAPLAMFAANLAGGVETTRQLPGRLRMDYLLESAGISLEMLDMVRDFSMRDALVSARQGFIETGSSYAGLHLLRRVSEREVEIAKELRAGAIPADAVKAAEQELIELARLRTHLPIMINNANIAEGGAHPVLVWNRGDNLELELQRGQSPERLQRELEKLLLAVEREAQPLQNNPLYRVPGAEGPGWKLGMIMRRIETAAALTREQFDLALRGERRFGDPAMLEAKVLAMDGVVAQLRERVSLFESTGRVFAAGEREKLVQRHQDTESSGEALARWTYTLREAISSSLPMEIPGSAKSRGGIIQSYITNEQDKDRGVEILQQLKIDGPVTDRTIRTVQTYVRDGFLTEFLMSLTAADHGRRFDKPQDLGYAVGGAGAGKLRLSLGNATSLFSAREITPGDCRAHAQLFGGFSDLQTLRTYQAQAQAALLALMEGDMATFARIAGRATPNLLRREISQTTAEMMVTGQVNNTYDFPHGASTTRATFVDRPWKPGDPLSDYEKRAGIFVINAGRPDQRVEPAAQADRLNLQPGDMVVLASKAEEHTYSNQTSFGLKPLVGGPAEIAGIGMMEPDLDNIADYRARDTFYNRRFVAKDAPPEQQSLYDLGNRSLQIVGWITANGERMPVLDGGPIDVERPDGTIYEGRCYMIPRFYSKNPVMYDALMAVSIKAFGMDTPEAIHQLEHGVARDWYDSWIDRIPELTEGIV